MKWCVPAMLDKADYSIHTPNTKNIHSSHISGPASKALLQRGVKALTLTRRASNILFLKQPLLLF